MKKFFASLLTLLTLAVVAAPDAEQIFRNTTRYVDFDGNALLYYNTTELLNIWQQFPSRVAAVAADFVDAPYQNTIPMVQEGADIIVKTLNLQALKAVAYSQKQLKNGLFVSKSSLYIGKDVNLPGIFNYSKVKNDITLEQFLSLLPEDVIAAAAFQINTENLYTELDKNINNSKNQELLMSYAMLKTMLLSTGIDPAKLAASASGKYLLIAAGKTPETMRFALTVPDYTGAVTAVLKKNFPTAAATPDRSMLPPRNGMKPALLYLDKCVILVSDFDRCTKLCKPFGIPENFRNLLPAKAGAYGVINFSPDIVKCLQTLDPVNKELDSALQKLSSGIKSGLAVKAAIIERDGARTIEVSNFSLEEAYYKFLINLSSIR